MLQRRFRCPRISSNGQECIQDWVALSLLLITAMVAAFAVGLSKGGLPSVGTLSVPFLALVMPPLVAATLLLPIFLISDLVGIFLYRREYSARNLLVLAPAGLAGVGLGWLFGGYMSSEILGMLVGAVGLFYCYNAWFKPNVSKDPRPVSVPAGVGWGALAGLTSFVSHSGGPAFQMHVLPQRLPKMIVLRQHPWDI